jgi:TonB family protein
MTFRCLLFSSDGETATLISNVLAGLDVEAEVCSEAVASVGKIASQPFHIVIIDWDMQPEAGLLLTAARERKASDRPLTLAIVGDDASVPKAMQAGANSILRRPIAIQQVKDTLKTARDLLRARLEPAPAPSAAAAAAGASASSPTGAVKAPGEPPRKAEFLQPRGTSTLFEIESDMQKSIEQSAASEVEALKELEPMAAAVQKEPTAAPVPAPQASAENEEPRGLEWFLKRSTGGLRPAQMSAAAPAPMPLPVTPPAPAKPELLGFDQTPSYAPSAPTSPPSVPAVPVKASEEKTEAKLFAYMEGERPEPKASPSRFRLGKKSMVSAAALAICAILAAPQAPWHAKVRPIWRRGQQTVHGWLNPQLVTTPQAPTSHESFARPGDEYKLPVAEPIPDATTDPSQIRVTPVIDPTAKKTNEGAVTPDSSAQTDGTVTTGTEAKPTDPFQSTTIHVQEQTAGQAGAASGSSAPAAVTQPASTNASPSQPSSPVAANSANTASEPLPAATALGPATPLPAHSASALASAVPSAPRPVPAKNPQAAMIATNAGIPSSLRSQLAPSVPDLSGNKAAETAMDSIEPVVIPESASRSLAIQQPAPPYPATARGQQGTVVLQVLIGRDGTVQDAKFLQGSLAFARNAIDGVKLWKFRPYIMNARPVSVQTQITISFRPES